MTDIVEVIAVKHDLILIGDTVNHIVEIANTAHDIVLVSGNQGPPGADGADGVDVSPEFELIAQAVTQSGLVGTNDTVRLIALTDNTVRINALTKCVFASVLATGNVVGALKSFPQTDFILVGPSIPNNNWDIWFISYDVNGAIIITESTTTLDPALCMLGYMGVKNVNGTYTFVDGAAGPRNVVNSPSMAGFSALEREYLVISSDVGVFPNANLTMQNSAGAVKGTSINWLGTGNKNVRPVAAANPLNFTRLVNDIGIAVPPITSTLIVSNFWNGVALQEMTGNQASVQRAFITASGRIFIQPGTIAYTSLDAAKAGAQSEVFSNAFPPEIFTELFRIAAKRNATDLSNTNQAAFIYTNRGGGGTSGVSPDNTLIVALAEIALGGNRMVMAGTTTGTVTYAGTDIINSASRVLGMTLGSAILGDYVTIQPSGVITEPSWNWNVTLPVFLSTNGLLTQTSPASGFSLVVGKPISPTKLLLAIQQPIAVI